MCSLNDLPLGTKFRSGWPRFQGKTFIARGIFFWILLNLNPPHPLELLPFSWKMRTVLNRMKNQFFDLCDFYFLSYGWLYLQFTKNLPTVKKLFKSGQIYREDADCSENDFQSNPHLSGKFNHLWTFFLVGKS